MITFTEEEFKKIDMIGKVFTAFNTDDLKELVESEEIVAKLQGKPLASNVIRRIIDDNNLAHSELISLRIELQGLRTDIQMLIKPLKQLYETVPAYSQELQNLKSKYGVY